MKEREMIQNQDLPRVGFIGAGKAGRSLGCYLAGAAAVSGYLSQNPASAEAAARATGSLAFTELSALAAASGLILVTTPDDRIADVWETLRPHLQNGLFVGHLSGSLGSEIFAGAAEAGVHPGSLHPLASLTGGEADQQTLHAAYFTIEGDAAFRELAGTLLTALGNPFAPIAAHEKVLYHAACTVSSNLIAAAAQMGAELFRSCGLPEDFAERAWRPLFLGAAENIAAEGPMAALTGPIERGDLKVIEKHLAALQNAPAETQDAYRALSLIAAKIAKERHPERNDTGITSLLRGEESK
ncbi:MAG: DUF2520 domain-containing protein [Clostridiales bacterium]|nr:DUF2520 domain-containing protein [Clostridiales bacterium]